MADKFVELEVHPSRYGQLRYLQGKGGSSCSTKLCTTAVEICSTVLPSSPAFPKWWHTFEFLWANLLPLHSPLSGRTADEVWPVPWHESAAERAWVRGIAADSVFFFFGGLSPRLRERQRVQASAWGCHRSTTHTHTVTSGPCLEWWRRGVLQGDDDKRRR